MDALAAQLVAGTWTAPKEGSELKLPDGSLRKWEAAKAAQDGTISHAALRGGYAYVAVPSDKSRPMILEASGHTMVYVNGEPRVGDVYQHGYVRLPVQLRSGTNHFLFHGGRGSVRAKLIEPKAVAQLNPSDVTLPDLVVGERIDTEGAVVVLNASEQPLTNLSLQVTAAQLEDTRTDLPPIPPWSIHKCGFRLVGPPPREAGHCDVSLKLVR